MPRCTYPFAPNTSLMSLQGLGWRTQVSHQLLTNFPRVDSAPGCAVYCQHGTIVSHEKVDPRAPYVEFVQPLAGLFPSRFVTQGIEHRWQYLLAKGTREQCLAWRTMERVGSTIQRPEEKVINQAHGQVVRNQVVLSNGEGLWISCDVLYCGWRGWFSYRGAPRLSHLMAACGEYFVEASYDAVHL